VDEALVKVEAALHARALARRRGEAAGDAARESAIAAQADRIAKSGLHHAALSEATLLQALETLGAEGVQLPGAEGVQPPGAEGARPPGAEGAR
jgi:hypothetical protein